MSLDTDQRLLVAIELLDTLYNYVIPDYEDSRRDLEKDFDIINHDLWNLRQKIENIRKKL